MNVEVNCLEFNRLGGILLTCDGIERLVLCNYWWLFQMRKEKDITLLQHTDNVQSVAQGVNVTEFSALCNKE